MFNPWYPVMLLAFEASEVVTLRMLKMGLGGADAWDEAHLMVSEKICAGIEVFSSMMTGGLACVERYREHVAANASRLVSTKPRPVSEQELARILQERTGLLPRHIAARPDPNSFDTSPIGHRRGGGQTTRNSYG